MYIERKREGMCTETERRCVQRERGMCRERVIEREKEREIDDIHTERWKEDELREIERNSIKRDRWTDRYRQAQPHTFYLLFVVI